jgi:hypothetical protein
MKRINLNYFAEIAKDSMESENDPVEKRTKGAPGMELNPFKKCLSVSVKVISPFTRNMCFI